MNKSNLPAVRTDETKKDAELALIIPMVKNLEEFIELSKKGKGFDRDQKFGIYTIDRVVKTLDKSLSITQLRKHSPELSKSFIRDLFLSFCFDVNFERTLTPGNIEELIGFINEKYYFYTYADIHCMLQMLKKGELFRSEMKYEKEVFTKIEMFNNINISTMYDALKAYDRVRNEIIASSRHSHSYYNPDRKSTIGKDTEKLHAAKLNHFTDQLKNKKLEE